MISTDDLDEMYLSTIANMKPSLGKNPIYKLDNYKNISPMNRTNQV